MNKPRRKNNSLSAEKVYVTYKDNLPARVIDVKKTGRKIYLLISWENDALKPAIWVKDSLCEEYLPEKKPFYKTNKKGRGKASLNWFQKLIVKLQNWYYDYRD